MGFDTNEPSAGTLDGGLARIDGGQRPHQRDALLLAITARPRR